MILGLAGGESVRRRALERRRIGESVSIIGDNVVHPEFSTSDDRSSGLKRKESVNVDALRHRIADDGEGAAEIRQKTQGAAGYAALLLVRLEEPGSSL